MGFRGQIEQGQESILKGVIGATRAFQAVFRGLPPLADLVFWPQILALHGTAEKPFQKSVEFFYNVHAIFPALHYLQPNSRQ